jgi:hypothetical protein
MTDKLFCFAPAACVLGAALIRVANADSYVVQKCNAAAFCPGTFENSQQHARVIYGWVHGSQLTQSPAENGRISISQKPFKEI